MMQETIGNEEPKVCYSYGPYNHIKGSKQWVRLSQGCPHNCPWCYEPRNMEVFRIPKLERKDIGIIDMNLLAKPEALDMIKSLPKKGYKYEFVCGIDYRFLTPEIAEEMKKHHFHRIRIAWDWYYKDQRKIRKALDLLHSVGYKYNDMMVFMICNHCISFEENMKKLDLCKVWNVKVCDCYYDNQTKIFSTYVPNTWTTEQAQSFRRKVRKHNQLVNFRIDPQVSE